MADVRSIDAGIISEAVCAVTKAFHEATSLFAQDPLWAGRDGGYFCLADARNGFPLLLVPVVRPLGKIPLEKAAKYLGLSQEKDMRLAQHPEHFSSWQSRNDKESKFGGAVRILGRNFSFSGLPELGDEAVSLVTAVIFNRRLFGIRFQQLQDVAREITAISHNEYTPKLFSAVGLEL